MVITLAVIVIILQSGLASAAAAAAPALFKNVRSLAVQLDATAGAAAPAQSWQYALPADVQVLTMTAPGGDVLIMSAVLGPLEDGILQA
jgi:hypothetical protein